MCPAMAHQVYRCTASHDQFVFPTVGCLTHIFRAGPPQPVCAQPLPSLTQNKSKHGQLSPRRSAPPLGLCSKRHSNANKLWVIAWAMGLIVHWCGVLVTIPMIRGLRLPQLMARYHGSISPDVGGIQWKVGLPSGVV